MLQRKWSVTRVFIYGFALASFAAILLIWSIYQVTTTIMSTATSVSQTYEVISAIKNLQSHLIDAETGERGYVITGDPGYFPAYHDSLQKIQWESDLIAALTADNPVQKVNYAALQRLIAYRLKTIQMIVETRKAGGVDAAHQLVSIDEDKVEMDRIQVVLNRIEEEENNQLNVRIHARDVAYQQFWWDFGALIVMMVAGAVWQYLQVRRILQLESQAKQRIRHMAEHDPLTDLPNRRQLQAKLELAIAFAKRSGKMVAVMFIDLDGFKAVNDTLGHQVGDDLLKEVAQKLRHGTRSSDLVARLGGDEFVVVLSELDSPDDATLLASKLNELIARPISIAGKDIRISTSIGISIYPSNGHSGEDLLGKADDAVYQAKAAGKNQYQWAAPSHSCAEPDSMPSEEDDLTNVFK
ncbi:MAG TPA: diguanylate cyclase [Burkholderiaceae bacterium]|nr:diguanylate cyclase [Burkholderiaceae bacterium]